MSDYTCTYATDGSAIFRWKIRNLAQLLDSSQPGDRLVSAPFEFDDQPGGEAAHFCLKLFPKGKRQSDSKFTSIQLSLIDIGSRKLLRLNYRMWLEDTEGKLYRELNGVDEFTAETPHGTIQNLPHASFDLLPPNAPILMCCKINYHEHFALIPPTDFKWTLLNAKRVLKRVGTEESLEFELDGAHGHQFQLFLARLVDDLDQQIHNWIGIQMTRSDGDWPLNIHATFWAEDAKGKKQTMKNECVFTMTQNLTFYGVDNFATTDQLKQLITKDSIRFCCLLRPVFDVLPKVSELGPKDAKIESKKPTTSMPLLTVTTAEDPLTASKNKSMKTASIPTSYSFTNKSPANVSIVDKKESEKESLLTARSNVSVPKVEIVRWIPKKN
ncbi:hypothetical protein M3Y94_00783500 [Aphelenchoides besseyi]|nr:hypothetical protein M3Y94_00783500 [Aphelenchoides besseyi]